MHPMSHIPIIRPPVIKDITPGSIVWAECPQIAWSGFAVVYRVHGRTITLTGEDGQEYPWTGDLPVIDVIIVTANATAQVIEMLAALDDIMNAIRASGMPPSYYGPLPGYRPARASAIVAGAMP
jgi:hypothetical protein